MFFVFCFCFGQAGYLLQHKGSFIVACELSCPMTCGILVPGPEIKHLRPLQWKGGILTTGLSGKSQNFLLKKKKLREINFYLAYALFKNCLLCATGSVAWTSNSRLGPWDNELMKVNSKVERTQVLCRRGAIIGAIMIQDDYLINKTSKFSDGVPRLLLCLLVV